MADDDVEPVDEAPAQVRRKTSVDLIHGGYPMCVQLRHIGSANKAQFCLLPREYSLQSNKLLDLVKKTWGLTLPNLIIACDAGSAHPMQLGTTKLASLPQYQQWLQDARRHRDTQLRQSSGDAAAASDVTTPARPQLLTQATVLGGRTRMASPASPAAAAAAPPPSHIEATEEDLDMINTLMFQKMITTMAAVLDAAAMSNNWILIDRTTNRSAKSATAELLLELAMEQTDQRPTVLVIDTVERLEAFTSETSRRQLDILQKLGRSAVPLGEVEENGASVSLEWPYEPSAYLDPTAFYKKDLPRKPFDAHVIDAEGNVSDKRKWMYHYNQCIFGAGTHYIIMDTADDAFELEALGTVGNVVAHGGTLAYRRLRGHIQMGHPTVMLYNTGGATQAFGSLHRAITDLQANEGRLPDAEELLPQIELTAQEKWVKGFGLPEIMMMKELAERAPQLFRHTIVTCDLVNDSAEDVLETITSCFSSGTGGVPELGLGNAEANVVFVAWKRHLALFVNADRFLRWSHAVQYIIYALGLLTTISSVLYGLFETANQDVESNEATATVLQRAVIVLPLLSALLSTIRARLKSRDKYAACLVASAEVAAEIYKYRLRTIEYDTQKLSMAGLDEAAGEETAGGIASKGGGVKGAEQRTRDLFVGRVQNIYSAALGSEVQSSGALRHEGVLAANIEAPRERAAFVARLKEHVATNVYRQRREDRQNILEASGAAPAATKGGKGGKGPKAKLGQVAPIPSGGKAAAPSQGFRADGSSRAVEPDDFASPMSIESYVQYRVRPFVAHLEKSAPRLARTLQVLEVLVFVSNSLGAVLAIIVVGDMSLANFVAVTVALSAIFSSMIEYHNLQLQVTASNGALRETHNLLVWWAGLSMVDRRTRFTKHHVCSTLERCLLSTIAAESAAVIQSSGGDGADGMDEE